MINRLTQVNPSTTLGTPFGRDDLYRLTSSTLPSETFAYDQVGNRNPASFVYNNANRLLDDGTYTYAYDDNGNCISKTNKSNPSDVTNYTYNVENQLIRVTSSSGNQADYTYDGLGRRIEKNVNGTITRYVYDNEDIVTESDGNNTLLAFYLHGPGIDEPLWMRKGAGWPYYNYYFHADGLGSITAITDSSGATVKTYRYDAFGNIVSQTGTLVNPYTYTGREFDAETSLYYYRARYYDARIGRFLQEDRLAGTLINPQSLNLYPYVENNPIVRIDPIGFWYIDINVSGGFWGGATGGILIGPKGVYRYEGGGIISPKASLAIMWSPYDIAQGWNLGLQFVGGIAYQRSEAWANTKSRSWELGAGISLPTFWGASLAGYYVHEPWTWPWVRNATEGKDKCKK